MASRQRRESELIHRTAIRPKARKAKTSWRNPERVRLDAAGIRELRWEVFNRAEFCCEALGDDGLRCRNRIGWLEFELHHVIHRSQGGGDTKENCIAACWEHHRAHHNGGPRIEPWRKF